MEVVNSRTGKLSDIVPSRLCKQLLFETFLGLWDSIASMELRQKVLEKKLLPAGVVAGLLSAALARSSVGEKDGKPLPGMGGELAKDKREKQANNGVKERVGGSGESGSSGIPSLFDTSLPFVIDKEPSTHSAQGWEGSKKQPPKQGEGLTANKETVSAMPFSEGFKSGEVSPPIKTFPMPSPSPHLLSSITALQVRKHCTYGEVKSMAVDYQLTKERFSSHFELNWGSGWVGKPAEQDRFTL